MNYAVDAAETIIGKKRSIPWGEMHRLAKNVKAAEEKGPGKIVIAAVH